MIELVYISKSVNRFNEQQLKDLLRLARINNKKLDVTGLLLYDGYGTFIQALEGPENSVETLFNIIKADKRHSNINRIGYRDITERTFNDWQMGYKQLSTSSSDNSNIPGMSSFMDSNKKYEYINNNQSFALKMLEHFRNDT